MTGNSMAADTSSRHGRCASGKTSERRAHSWYDKTPDELVNQLANDLGHVLSQAEAAPRLANVGANTLQKGDAFSLLMIWCSQFRGLGSWVLVGAALISTLIGETIDGIAIVAIGLLNAVIGFFQ
jgi:Ca2+-transporting ATPase